MSEDALDPQLDWNDIQGNILGGFNKDHQTLLGFRFGPDLPSTKALIAKLAARVTDLETVHSYKKQRLRRTQLEGAEPADMPATWVCLSFSFAGLLALTPEADAFADLAFRSGLAASASRLGDPQDPSCEGNVSHWKVGGDDSSTPAMFVIVAADRLADLNSAVHEILDLATVAGSLLIYSDTGHDPAWYSTDSQSFPAGHEHFGFKDGISQPGIRGTLPTGDRLTPRHSGAALIDIEYAAPGVPLVCVGQFLLGYAQQVDVAPRTAGPAAVLGPKPYAPDPNAVAPWWAFNGSFLVFRRLAQDVAAFRNFTAVAREVRTEIFRG